jgi:hypothetical protein
MAIDWMVQSFATYEKSVIAGMNVMSLDLAVEDLIVVLSAVVEARPV